MSITAANCHYYRVLNIPDAPTSPTKISMSIQIKPITGGAVGRYFAALDSGDDWNSERKRLALLQDGGGFAKMLVQPALSSGWGVPNETLSMHAADSLDKWMVASGFYDLASSGDDAGCLVGRSAAPAVAANVTAPAGDWPAWSFVSAVLKDLYVHRSSAVMNADGGSDTTNNYPLAHLAIWYDYKLTVADHQALTDGTNPQDIGGGTLQHYFPLRDSTDGLLDIINGLVLVPVGGAATATYLPSDNPTVNAPTGGSVDGSATGATLTGTSSLTAGSATGNAEGTANGATLTGTSSLTAGSATGNATGSFTTAAMENNTGAGLLASTSVAWTWYEGAIGSAPTSTTHGTGTTNSSGILTAAGLPIAAGFLLVRTTDSSGVYYQAGTPA